MTTFHSPYHFVPMSKWVYMPDYAHEISHDIPLQQGISGIIDLKLKTITPTCVGDKQSQEQRKASKVHFARNPLNELVIPSTSIKGMLRSALEIATFSKLQNLDDTQLSFRDISSANNHYGKIIKENKPIAGWLSYNDKEQQWQFRSCKFAKVHHDEIGKNLGIQIKNEYSAVEKYQKMPLKNAIFANVSAPRGKQENRWAEELSFDGTRAEQGHLVFTNMRILGKGEKSSYEFSYFFYDYDSKQQPKKVNQQAANLFTNHGEEQVNHLKRYGNKHGMPVFALMQAGKVHSLGFARMPRVSYKNSVHDMVQKQNAAHFADSYFDFSELMFGCIRDYGFGLKSRVSFSDFCAVDVKASELFESNLLVLNGPKPSFYPAYVEQNLNQPGYQSYENDKPIAGTKRYISRKPDQIKLKSNAKENLNVASTMELCPTGKHFAGQIVFHNLHPLELGALLWTILLEQNIVHQIGHGKPMGAGAVRFSSNLNFAEVNDGSPVLTVESYIENFIAHMNSVHPASALEDEPAKSQAWYKSPQVQYLLAIGRIEANAALNTDYLDINNKEFQTAKNQGAKLDLLQNIKREEKGASYGADKRPSLAYNKGRLAELFDRLEDDEKRSQQDWHDSVIKAREKREKEAADELAKEAHATQVAKKKSSMSEYAYMVDTLAEELLKLAASNAQPEITAKLNHTLDIFINDVRESEQESAERLYWLAREYKYHQPSKKNKEKHKKILQELCTTYRITPAS